MTPAAPVRVLILGGGFGGVTAARGLAKSLGHAAEITLVNRDNHFLFVPLLASAAAGSLEPMHVVAPIRRLLKKNVQFRAEEVTGIDLARRAVTTVSPTTGREAVLGYDHLVIALGNVVNLSRLPGVAQHGKTLKTLGDAFAIRNQALAMLEAADIEPDPALRRELLTFVIAGGGFSGVEMAGELNDLVRGLLPSFPRLRGEHARVILLHSGTRILPELSAGIARYAHKQLQKRGVEVRLGMRLGSATPHEAVLEGGEKVPTRTLIVAVGNAPPPVLEGLSLPRERDKIAVDPLLQVPGFPGVWALGDNAAVPNQATPDTISPPTAQFALRQGKTLAHNLAAAIRGGQPKPFSYTGAGQLCLVGHGAGVGEMRFGLKPKGFLGWFLWRSVYWSKMPSFGRKLQVGADWALDLLVPHEMAQLNLARTQTVGKAHFEEGETIFRQGDPGDHFYLITSGEVEVIRERSSGDHHVLARLGRGEYFGETALLNRGRRNATIRCVTAVDVITLGRDDFATIAGSWRALADQLREVSDRRAAAGPHTLFMPAQPGAALPGNGPWTARAVLAQDGGLEFPLDREITTIGRTPDNHIGVPEASVSRRHALIHRDGDAWWIEDLGGVNGVWLNGERIAERAPLHDGDRASIGRTGFVFCLRPASAPAEPSITSLIRDLDPPAAAVAGPAREPAEVAGLICTPVPPATGAESVTGLLHALDAPLPNRAPITPAVPRLDLRVIDGPATGATYALSGTGGLLGRAPENAVCILDEQLSRRHAQVGYEQGIYWLMDLGSTNGTAVNGERLARPHPLRSGDVIHLGASRLLVTLSSTG